MLGPAIVYSGFLPVNDVEVMETGDAGVTSKRERKVVSLQDEDQVSSPPSSWFGPEVMTFFRYADVFLDEMEVDPATAEDKSVPNWEIKKKDSLIHALTAKMFLFGINTLVDHSRSQKMKSQEFGSVVLANQAQSNVYVVELYCRWVEA
ncbi:hypothetical protein Hanom_Chr10g00942541 [Helianthus anomalus]